MNKIRAFWWDVKNFGDQFTPILLRKLLPGWRAELAAPDDRGKLVGCGSIACYARPGDIVWGTGWHKPWRRVDWNGVQATCVRGPLTREMIDNCDVPEIYGDPGMLLPRIYSPKVEKEFKCGIVPHYVEFIAGDHPAPAPYDVVIDLRRAPHLVIQQMLACERIASSSLHGVIVAEAYGLPTSWHRWSDRIIGGRFKFDDYFLGTGRERPKPGRVLVPLDPGALSETSARLERILKDILASGRVTE
jgi:pyruvyltransferase